MLFLASWWVVWLSSRPTAKCVCTLGLWKKQSRERGFLVRRQFGGAPATVWTALRKAPSFAMRRALRFLAAAPLSPCPRSLRCRDGFWLCGLERSRWASIRANKVPHSRASQSARRVASSDDTCMPAGGVVSKGGCEPLQDVSTPAGRQSCLRAFPPRLSPSCCEGTLACATATIPQG